MKTLFLAVVGLGVMACSVTPTPTTIGTPAAVGTKVTFVNPPRSVTQGDNVTFNVKTDPSTLCKIRLYLRSGPSNGSGALLDKPSDAAGKVSWTWTVESGIPLGLGWVDVTCGDVTAETVFHVT